MREHLDGIASLRRSELGPEESAEVRLWRPSDFEEITEALCRKATGRKSA